MRIGIIHSFYRSEIPSGENLTVVDIAKILNDLGHEVTIWRFDSDSVFSSRTAQLRQMLKIFGWTKKEHDFEQWVEHQDVIQIHNYFPGMSFSNLRSIEKHKLRVNRVIHNYRKTCIQGNHYRKNKLCQKCDQLKRFSGVIRRCYNKKFILSLFVVIYTKKLEKFEKATNTHYIAISSTMSSYLNRIGVSEKRIAIIPNSVPELPPILESASECVFFGRIESEKGVFLLVEAWKIDSTLPTLHVVGNGTKLVELQKQSKELKNVKIHGAKYGEQLELILQHCKVAIFPGLWEEPFGRTLVESLARGQAVACSEKFSHVKAVIEGVNGSVFKMNSRSIVDAVQMCLRLESKKQINTSNKMWQEFYSPSAVSLFWKKYYSEPSD